MSVAADCTKKRSIKPSWVIVEPGEAGAHGLEIIIFVGLGGVLAKSDSGGWPNVGEPHVDGRGRRFAGLFREQLSAAGNANSSAESQDGTQCDSEFARNGHRVRSAMERASRSNCCRAATDMGSPREEEVAGALARVCSMRFTSRPPALLPLKRLIASRKISSARAASPRCA